MREPRHPCSLPRDIGELVRHLVAFAKPARPPGVQASLAKGRGWWRLCSRCHPRAILLLLIGVIAGKERARRPLVLWFPPKFLLLLASWRASWRALWSALSSMRVAAVLRVIMSREDAPASWRLATIADVLFMLGAIAFPAVLPCLTAAYLIPDRARAEAIQTLGIVAGAVGLVCWSLCAVLRLRHSEEC
jgi:hypothetical protein